MAKRYRVTGKRVVDDNPAEEFSEEFTNIDHGWDFFQQRKNKPRLNDWSYEVEWEHIEVDDDD